MRAAGACKQGAQSLEGQDGVPAHLSSSGEPPRSHFPEGPMSQLFASGGQSIGASASVLPMNLQEYSGCAHHCMY